ncbi:ribonuclease HI [Pseudomonas aeruginosa]
MSLKCYTDGACKGNPGPGGWGYHYTTEVAGAKHSGCGGELNTTNNRMEMMAVIMALEALPAGQTVEVVTDSDYVVKGINEWLAGWKKRGWKTAAKQPVKNEDLWRRIDALRSTHAVTWTWVRGHNGDPGNEKADKLANEGVRLAR